MKKIIHIRIATGIALCFLFVVNTELRGQEIVDTIKNVEMIDGVVVVAEEVVVVEEEKKKRDAKMFVGITGGAGYYNVSFDPVQKNTGGISPVFGVVFRYESPRNRAIEAGVRYRSSGWELADSYLRELKIIEVPVLAHVSFGKKKMKAFFTLGETITFIISDEETAIDTATHPIFADHPVDNTIGFALNLGVGVERQFGRSLLQFELRGQMTISGMYKQTGELPFQNSNAYFIEGAITYLFRVN